jgi:hypothetical protein
MEANNLMKIYLISTIPLLYFVLVFVSMQSGQMVPFSAGAFLQPYSGESGIVSIVLASLAAGDFLLINLYLIPTLLKDTKAHITALASTEMPAVFGFVLGILSLNPWAAIPYFLVSAANFAYVYSKASGPVNV